MTASIEQSVEINFLTTVKSILILCLLLQAQSAFATVTYNGTTGVNAQIFSGVCSGCHFTGSGLPVWSNYATADANIANIVDRINRAATGDPSLMPQGGPKLSTTLLNLVDAWDSANEPLNATPQVSTSANGALTQYTAVMNGTIRENGINTNGRFRYWRNAISEPGSCPSNTTNSGCTSQTSPSGTGGNDAAVSFSRTATGLACGTLYRYRALSVNNGTYGDQSAGNTDTFTTSACPAFTNSGGTSATEDVLYQYDANANQTVTYSLTVFPAGMTINSTTGLVQWTPGNGVASANVTVQITDGTTPATQAYVINVTAVNDPPVIAGGDPQAQFAQENGSANFTLNASDIEGNTMAWSVSSAASNGGVTGVTGTGASKNITYTPNPGFSGMDSFDVTVTDNGTNPANLSDTVTINVTISEVDDPPVITEGATTGVTMDEDGTPMAFSLTLNATDDEGDTISWSIASAAGNGVASVSGTGTSRSVSYTPTANYNGADSFVVRVTDNTFTGNDSDDITVTVTINARPDAPVAQDNGYTVAVNVANLELDVRANDSDVDIGDTMTIISTTAPSGGGSVVIGAPCSAGTLCYTAPNNYAFVETFDYTIQDSATLQDTATVTITPSDVDNDTIVDFLDNCVNTSNVGQQNNDGDSEGDACDTDDDNDGMPDTWEVTNGLDPFNAADASIDTDGDGVSNLQEFINGTDPNLDDVGPVISGVSDKVVTSTGYFTFVNLGNITASDASAGPRPVSIVTAVGTTSIADSRNSLFRTGRTTLTHETTDLAMNTIQAAQIVDVLPLATFESDVAGSEGNAVQFRVVLSGAPPQYPVTIDYALSGTASAADHNLTAGTLTINNPNTTFTFNVTLIADGAPEADEVLNVTLSNPNNAALGNKTVEQVTIVSSNFAPVVNFTVAQGGNTGPLVTQAGGNVTVTANVVDPNSADTHTYNWMSPGNALVAIGGTGTTASPTFQFDPAAVAQAGLYALNLGVTDNGVPAATANTSVMLNVKATAPVLAAVDTDGDGTDDDVEGYQDTDGDGVPDHLDAFDQNGITFLLPNQTGSLPTSKFLEVASGNSVRLGAVAQFAGASGVLINGSDVTSYSNAMGGSVSLATDSYDNIGGIYDFEIYGIAPGESASIVVPLLSGMLANAEYRKFDLTTGWRAFVVDANNQVASARNINGSCPGPTSSSYTSGLNVFSDCIRITLQDGGPNDSDGVADGVIRDPGGVAVQDVSPGPEAGPVPDNGSGGGGGLLHPLTAFLMGLFVLFCFQGHQVRTFKRRKSKT